MAEKPQFMTPKEYAAVRGVHINTVMKWLREKKIQSEQPGGKGGRFFIPLGSRQIYDERS